MHSEWLVVDAAMPSQPPACHSIAAVGQVHVEGPWYELHQDQVAPELLVTSIGDLHGATIVIADPDQGSMRSLFVLQLFHLQMCSLFSTPSCSFTIPRAWPSLHMHCADKIDPHTGGPVCWRSYRVSQVTL